MPAPWHPSGPGTLTPVPLCRVTCVGEPGAASPTAAQGRESISGAQSTPQPVGHVSRHDSSPVSRLTLVLLFQQLSRHSSEAMGGCRCGGPGGLSTAERPQENLWVHHNACWHPHHPALELGMPQQSRTGPGGGSHWCQSCLMGPSSRPPCPGLCEACTGVAVKCVVPPSPGMRVTGGTSQHPEEAAGADGGARRGEEPGRVGPAAPGAAIQCLLVQGQA